MNQSANPYSPPGVPQPDEPKAKPGRSRARLFASVIACTLLGGSVTAGAVYEIFVDDPRTGTEAGITLNVAVVMGTLLSGFLWFLAGCFQPGTLSGLIKTFTFAAAVAGAWILVGGTYADVLGAAACVAWPLGGLVISVSAFLRRDATRRNIFGS